MKFRLFLFIAVSFFVACGDNGPADTSFDFEKEGGTEYTLKVDVKDFLSMEAGYPTNESFYTCMMMVSEEKDMPDEVWIDRFIETFGKENPTLNLRALFFMGNREKYQPSMSEKEFKSKLMRSLDEVKSKTKLVVEQRLKNTGIQKFNVIKTPEGIKVQVAELDKENKIKKMLQSSATVGFYETYNLTEAFPFIQKLNDSISAQLKRDTVVRESMLMNEADTVKINYPLLYFISINVSRDSRGLTYLNEGALLGYVLIRDTAEVNRLLLSDTTGILPNDLQFAWSKFPENEEGNIVGLYCLRAKHIRNPALSGKYITDAFEMENEMTGEIQVQLNFDATGTEKWQQLTRKNIGKNIAITLDGFIYSCPVVQQEITGGNSVISGNFTKEEAADLAMLLKSGALDCRIIISDTRHSEPH
ncbi:MAG: SecDF P1 head subdomain-containing protein [Bacteroidota bacterium]